MRLAAVPEDRSGAAPALRKGAEEVLRAAARRRPWNRLYALWTTPCSARKRAFHRCELRYRQRLGASLRIDPGALEGFARSRHPLQGVPECFSPLSEGGLHERAKSLLVLGLGARHRQEVQHQRARFDLGRRRERMAPEFE